MDSENKKNAQQQQGQSALHNPGPPIGLRDLKKDRVFRYYFKRHKEDLIHLLNSYLPLPENEKIKEIRLLDERIQKDDFESKDSVLDIHVDMRGFGLANVEMQQVPEKDFCPRVLYYLSRIFGSQLKEKPGEGRKRPAYKDLRPAYSLLLCGKSLFPSLKRHYATFSMRCDSQTDFVFSKDLRIVLAQLDQFRKDFLEKSLDGRNFWSYILKEAPLMREAEFQKLSSAKEFGGVMDRLRQLTKDEAAEVFAEQAEKDRMDAVSHLMAAEERGLEKGLERGRRDSLQEIIGNMLKKKLAVSFISDVTGLPEAEVIKLQSSD